MQQQQVTGTATFVKSMQGWRGDARMYKIEPPLTLTDWDDKPTGEANYLIVSAADVMFSGPETYIFPADSADAKDPSDWGELPGSFRGALDHERALRNAGYTVVSA